MKIQGTATKKGLNIAVIFLRDKVLDHIDLPAFAAGPLDNGIHATASVPQNYTIFDLLRSIADPQSGQQKQCRQQKVQNLEFAAPLKPIAIAHIRQP